MHYMKHLLPQTCTCVLINDIYESGTTRELGSCTVHVQLSAYVVHTCPHAHTHSPHTHSPTLTHTHTCPHSKPSPIPHLQCTVPKPTPFPIPGHQHITASWQDVEITRHQMGGSHTRPPIWGTRRHNINISDFHAFTTAS